MQSVKDEVMASFKITPIAMGGFDSLLVWNHTPPGWNPGLKEPPYGWYYRGLQFVSRCPKEVLRGDSFFQL